MESGGDWWDVGRGQGIEGKQGGMDGRDLKEGVQTTNELPWWQGKGGRRVLV